MNPQDDDERLSANEIDEPEWVDKASQTVEGADALDSMNTDADQVPDDPDEAIAWLERLAARQGAPTEELPTVVTAVHDEQVEPFAEEMPAMDDMDAGEIPEDPDEAMAWLEMLAAKEVAHTGQTAASLSSYESEVAASADAAAGEEPSPVEESVAESFSTDLSEALDGSLPSGLDEALGWLEELTIEPVELEETATAAEALSAVEEPPMPNLVQDVDQAVEAPEPLIVGPEPDRATGAVDQAADELLLEDGEDAMAWLEMLAARQGAPIEELTTIDTSPGKALPGDDLMQATAPDEEVMAAAWPVEDTMVGAATDEELIEATPPDGELIEAAAPDEEVMAAAAPDEVDTGELDFFEEPASLSEQEIGEDLEFQGELSVPAIAEDESLESTGFAEEVGFDAVEPISDLEFAGSELQGLSLESPADLDVTAEIEAPMEDLAWLETLGAVDAEKWLEAEEADEELEVTTPVEPVLATGWPARESKRYEAPGVPPGASPDGPGAGMLLQARQALDAGELEQSLGNYAALIEQGLLLPFIIDDLEVISEKRGPEIGLQRVLGDAYARNGQLRKALESYREALANL